MSDFPLPPDAYELSVSPPAGFPDNWVEEVQTVGNSLFAHLGASGGSLRGSQEGGPLTFDPSDPERDEQTVLNTEILSLKGDSYRLRGKDLGARPGAEPAQIG